MTDELLKEADELKEELALYCIGYTDERVAKALAMIEVLSTKVREQEWYKTSDYYDDMGWYENIPETKQPEEGSRVWVVYDYDLRIATIHCGDFLIDGKDIGRVYQWSLLIEPGPPIKNLPRSDYKLTKGDWDKRPVPKPIQDKE